MSPTTADDLSGPRLPVEHGAGDREGEAADTEE